MSCTRGYLYTHAQKCTDDPVPLKVACNHRPVQVFREFLCQECLSIDGHQLGTTIIVRCNCCTFRRAADVNLVYKAIDHIHYVLRNVVYMIYDKALRAP